MNVYIYYKLIKASVLPLTVNILQLSTDSKTNAHCSQSAKSMECSIRTYPFCFLTLFVFLDLLPCFWICCTFLFTIAVLYVLNLWSIIRITLDGNKVQFGGGVNQHMMQVSGTLFLWRQNSFIFQNYIRKK